MSTPRFLAIAAVCAGTALGIGVYLQQPSPPIAPTAEAPTAPPSAATAATDLAWARLTPRQHAALEPLKSLWPNLSDTHKRKWLALSGNFHQLSKDEQAVLQGRMREWAALTPQQRTLARLNFADAKQISQDQKRAKWEAYQSLSAEEKLKLAKQQPKPIQSAAPAVKPTPSEKLVAPPTATANKPLPRIDTEQIERATLLPVAVAPTPSATTPDTEMATDRVSEQPAAAVSQ